MLGVSGGLASSGDGGAATEENGGGGGGAGGGGATGGYNSEELGEKGGERGNQRWPRQETFALLKIRSDMDLLFRDSTLKGPLWEQVSRKMGVLGYQRSGRKCKEKFENVYKYHKRTKDGRSSKPDHAKSYRFFDQLEALLIIDHHHHINNTASNSSSSSYLQIPQPTPPPLELPVNNHHHHHPQNITITTATSTAQLVTTVSSTPNNNNTTSRIISAPQNFSNLSSSSFPVQNDNTNANGATIIPPPPPPQNNIAPASSSLLSSSTTFSSSPSPSPSPSPSSSTGSSSSSSSEEDMTERRRTRRKRKRKKRKYWKDYLLERVTKDVIEKQEELQKRFLETLEKRERDRMVREDAWRVQEMARLNREHDLLVQERSMAAARESALISFLHNYKLNNQHDQPQQHEDNSNNPHTTTTSTNNNNAPPPSPPPPPPQVQIIPAVPIPENPPPPVVVLAPQPIRSVDSSNNGSNGNGEHCHLLGPTTTTSSRWPKAEVEALIKLRTSLDNKYQENGPKGALWEEISGGMRRLGYNRNPKRCKEKWENINKYFKKVKDSNKKRPQDSKTCPYFHLLDALYTHKLAPVPIMARPEQQWPHTQVIEQPQHESAAAAGTLLILDEHEGDINMEHHDDDDDDEGNGYKIVTTNNPSSSSVAATTTTTTITVE